MTLFQIVVHSPSEYEAVLYLNQMGVFNFVDDGTIQGCAVLKLSDGRKRSMSLWVEFITASGYLSARKIRHRFQNIVAQVLQTPQFRYFRGGTRKTQIPSVSVITVSWSKTTLTCVCGSTTSTPCRSRAPSDAVESGPDQRPTGLLPAFRGLMRVWRVRRKRRDSI